jgi:hypothetical protein
MGKPMGKSHPDIEPFAQAAEKRLPASELLRTPLLGTSAHNPR